MYEFCKAEIVYRMKFRCNKIFIYKYVNYYFENYYRPQTI